MPRLFFVLTCLLLAVGLCVSAEKNYYDILGVDKSASKVCHLHLQRSLSLSLMHEHDRGTLKSLTRPSQRNTILTRTRATKKLPNKSL